MNIALFASAFYPHVGGVEEHVRQLAHACRRKGHEVIVITNQWPLDLPAYEEYEDIPVYRLAMRIPEGSLKTRLKYRLTHTGTLRRLLDILCRHTIQMLHVHCVSVNGHYALLARQARDLALVVTTHGERTIDATGLYQRSAFMNRALRQLLVEADHITACSRHTLEDMEQYFGQPFGPRASVVYNGINLDEFAQVEPFVHQRPYILGIGRLVSQKGFDILLRAFANADMPNYNLLLAGEGPEQAALESLVSNLGLQQRVRFTGRANRPTAVALFKGCAFFVLPSRQEPFGIVNLEAMAAGKAIIASCVGGVPEIVQNEQNGLLVPAEDAATLAQALNRLAFDPQLRQRLAQNGQSRISKFTWPAIANQYLAIYQTVR